MPPPVEAMVVMKLMGDYYARSGARHWCPLGDRPKVVQFFATWIVSQEHGTSNVKLADNHGAKFVAQVGCIREAEEALRHSINMVICQGSKVLLNYQDDRRGLEEEEDYGTN